MHSFAAVRRRASQTLSRAIAMDSRIRSELRALKAYALIVTLALGTLSIAAFKQGTQRTKFTEIDVERINIVEPDGKLRMVLSNRPRSIGPIYKGQPFGYEGGSRPGIIFFNDEGTENGGLTFTGRRLPDGRVQASSGFSFDQFNQDQVLYFQYTENNGQRRMGFTIADRADVDIFEAVAKRDTLMKLPAGAAREEALRQWQNPGGVPMFAPRIFMGRTVARAAQLDLHDPNGKPRLRLRVDSLGAPSLEFLDASGKVTARFPETQR